MIVMTPSNRTDLILSPCCSVMTLATDRLIDGEQEVFEVVRISAAVQNHCFLRFPQTLLARKLFLLYTSLRGPMRIGRRESAEDYAE